jgi:hypothetical protein
VAITITLTEQDALEYLASKTSNLVQISEPNRQLEFDFAAPPTKTTWVATAAPAVVPEVEGMTMDDRASSVTFTMPVGATTSVPFTDPFISITTPVAETTSVPLAPTPESPIIPQPLLPKIDKDGIPWDQRIHTATQSLTKDGLWRLKRGVTDELLASVMTELKGVMAIPAPAAEVSSPPPPAPPATAIVWPHAPGYAVPPPPPPPPPMSFTDLASKLVQGVVEGKFGNDDIKKVLTSLGIAHLPLLANRPDLVSTVAETLGIK